MAYIPINLRFLEGDEDEDTCTISQEDIADSVDITSGAKVGIWLYTSVGSWSLYFKVSAGLEKCFVQVGIKKVMICTAY